MIPLLDSGTVLHQDHDFNVTVKCSEDGVAANSNYVIYLIYTDTNMTLDLKAKKFQNPLFK